jgi:hypothetical protein
MDGSEMSLDRQLTESEMVEEVEAILRTEQTGIGWMYRALKEGVPREKIMEEFQAQTSGFIYSYQKHISVLLFGAFPQAPSTSRQCAGVIRGFLKRNSGQLSGQTVEALTKRSAQLDDIAQNPVRVEAEDEALRETTRKVESRGLSGVYVYALPHYVKHPVYKTEDDALDDRTLMKVGRSDSDVILRFRQQQRNTALPEEPLLLRIYSAGGDMSVFESKFHSLLSAADHRRNTAKTAGTEWFLTSLKFLDALAKEFGMSTEFELGAVDEQ